MSAIAGRVLLIAKGDYSSATVYNTLDWVRHNNAAWVCKADNTQNDPPSTSSTKWALMAADSAYSSLGDLNDVSISSEAAGQFLGCVIDTTQTPPVVTWENVSPDTTYSSTGTGPISGTGVADALTDYYTKAQIPLPNILKYGGTKTGTELRGNSLLVAANEGYFYQASTAYAPVDNIYMNSNSQYISAGSLVAVLKTANNTYKYYLLTPQNEGWLINPSQGVVQCVVENSSTGWRTVTFTSVYNYLAWQPWAETSDGRVVKFRNPSYDGINYSFEANVTILPTKFYLKAVWSPAQSPL